MAVEFPFLMQAVGKYLDADAYSSWS